MEKFCQLARNLAKSLIAIIFALVMFTSTSLIEVNAQNSKPAIKIPQSGLVQIGKNDLPNTNNPNPFSERTEIKFYVPENSSNAFICIYDMVGSQLMKLNVTKSYSSIFVNGSELKAGMYMYSLIVDGKEIDTKRMILTDN